MRKIVSLLIFCVLLCKADLFSQSTQYNYVQIHRPTGTVTDSDPTSLNGTVVKRPYLNGDETAWYGPYLPLQAGAYQIQYRLKVSNNSSTSPIVKVDVSSSTAGKIFNSMPISPSMFSRSMEWQTFTINILVPVGVTDAEFRGMDFKANLNTDIYIDYINVIQTSTFFAAVANTGKVGIGTAKPQELLSVNGNILAKKVKVSAASADWPDYVFQQTYQLPPLQEVAEYIKQNNHLPGVPSAAEVKKEGLDLGDNQATLLKKIEELTLYTIEQNKKQEAQQRQLKELQALILKLNRVVSSQQQSINKLQKRVKK